MKVTVTCAKVTVTLPNSTLLYYILRLFVLPVLYVPGHAAPRADNIACQLGAEAVAILPEEYVILHGIFLN